MALNLENVKGPVSALEEGMRLLVREAQSNSEKANEVFGVDQMTKAEREAALHTTSLVCFLGFLKVRSSLKSDRTSRSPRKTRILSSFALRSAHFRRRWTQMLLLYTETQIYDRRKNMNRSSTTHSMTSTGIPLAHGDDSML